MTLDPVIKAFAAPVAERACTFKYTNAGAEDDAKERKTPSLDATAFFLVCRGGVIRTHDPLLPKQVR